MVTIVVDNTVTPESLELIVADMFYVIGIGLGDAKDITVKGLEIVKKASRVYLEAYTSILSIGKQELVTSWLFSIGFNQYMQTALHFVCDFLGTFLWPRSNSCRSRPSGTRLRCNIHECRC